jgi:hypothetical protein
MNHGFSYPHLICKPYIDIFCNTNALQAQYAQIQKHIDRPEFPAPTPQEIATSTKEIIFKRSGVTIAKLSPTVRVKYGEDVNPNEAKALEFVSRYTSIPVPKVLAAYTYGPIERDEEGPEFDAYIFTEYVEGQSLDKIWTGLDDSAKSNIMDELNEYFVQLRAIPGGDLHWIS